MIYSNVVESIGNTPLVKLNFNSNAQVYAKLEYLNPGGSVKDRSALFMVEQAEKNGLLKPGGTIVDASSGNHGIAIAMIGALKGYKVIITVSEKISDEKLKTIKAYGAEVIMCPATNFIDDQNSYHSQAVKIHKNLPGSFMPNQYYNTDNTLAHYSLLGPEIWKQTNGKVTHFIAAAGTGGTISGAGKYLKEQNSDIKVIAVDSNNSLRATKGEPKPYKIEGMGVDFVSPVLNYSIIDQFYEVSDEQGLGMLEPLASKHGVLAGLSSGAVAYAAKEITKNLDKSNLAVIIFGDSGRAYLTKNYYTKSNKETEIKNHSKKQKEINI